MICKLRPHDLRDQFPFTVLCVLYCSPLYTKEICGDVGLRGDGEGEGRRMCCLMWDYVAEECSWVRGIGWDEGANMAGFGGTLYV